jgi:hypothetical protein
MTAGSIISLAPPLRGEGWGEGLSQRARLAESPSHLKFVTHEFRKSVKCQFRKKSRLGNCFNQSFRGRNDFGFAKLTTLFGKVGINLLCGDDICIAAGPVSV